MEWTCRRPTSRAAVFFFFSKKTNNCWSVEARPPARLQPARRDAPHCQSLNCVCAMSRSLDTDSDDEKLAVKKARLCRWSSHSDISRLRFYFILTGSLIVKVSADYEVRASTLSHAVLLMILLLILCCPCIFFSPVWLSWQDRIRAICIWKRRRTKYSIWILFQKHVVDAISFADIVRKYRSKSKWICIETRHDSMHLGFFTGTTSSLALCIVAYYILIPTPKLTSSHPTYFSVSVSLKKKKMQEKRNELGSLMTGLTVANEDSTEE